MLQPTLGVWQAAESAADQDPPAEAHICLHIPGILSLSLGLMYFYLYAQCEKKRNYPFGKHKDKLSDARVRVAPEDNTLTILNEEASGSVVTVSEAPEDQDHEGQTTLDVDSDEKVKAQEPGNFSDSKIG